jgi:hypothetical protein
MSSFKILSVGGHSRELAPEHVIDALFTTIGCRLEPRGRGTRFPAVMEDLSSGYVTPVRATEALRELQEIEAALRQIPARDVVWSLAAFHKDDATEPVNHRAANALDYFVDTDGQPLISRLRDGLQECLNTAEILRLHYRKEARDGLLGGLFLVMPGVAWLLLGRAFFPDWYIAPLYNHAAKMPIWTFGMDLVILGVAFMIAQMFPGIRDWFRRHQAALMAVVIIAPIAWLAVCWYAGFLPD